jgi:predicted nucleic acid-binding protein
MDAKIKIIDASALGAMIFGEPEAQAIVGRLKGANLAAPSLLWLEMANLCLKKMKKYPQQGDAIRKAFDLALHLPIRTYDADPSQVLDLALNRGLTSYDAAYLWLAEIHGAELVTLDAHLMKAMQKGSPKRALRDRSS